MTATAVRPPEYTFIAVPRKPAEPQPAPCATDAAAARPPQTAPAHRDSSAAAGSAARDEGLDLLRGLAVVAMVVDHVGGASFLYAFTGGNRFFTSAAEGFVFISGLVMGLVYRRLIDRNGLGPSLQRSMERAATLYLLAVTLTLLFVPASELLGLPWAQGLSLSDPTQFIVSVLTLHQTYYLVDIPLLYALLLLASPLALILLAQGRTAAVLAGSWLLWGVYQLFPMQVDVPWAIQGNHLFFFAAWQVFFFTGLVLGWHRSELGTRLAGFPRRAGLIVSGAAFAVLVAFYACSDRLIALVAAGPEQATSIDLFLLETVFSKADARFGRIVASIVVFGFLYLLVTEAWRPLSRGLGWLLLPLGKNALYAYAAHVALAVPMQLVVGALEPQSIPLGLMAPVVQVSSVAGIWLLIKGRVLFVNPAKGAARYAWPAGAVLACLIIATPLASTAPPTVAAATVEPDPLEARRARVFGTPVPARSIGAGVAPSVALGAPEVARSSIARSAAPVTSQYVGPISGTLFGGEVFSAALERNMPYFVYLPPGYENGTSRYPVLYMLHGNSGLNEEWLAYGLIDTVDAMIAKGEIRPMIIVLPQGDYSYWVNLVGGPSYGDYLATDVVDYIKGTYRVLPGSEHRAIGGLSMGGTGALIHAFVNPSIFGVVGAHSPSLPEEGWRDFLGTGEDFAQRDPISLALYASWIRDLSIWVDVGDDDPWLARCEMLHRTLSAWDVPHQWNVFTGEHWGGYWSEHIEDYLRFYDAALHG
jgi:enterochelin esterase-like enzyme